MVDSIKSNVTGLAYAVETTPKVLPGSPVWYSLEPNTYSDFGGSITTVAREPISDRRQNKRGTTTDLDASGGFNIDMTQNNLIDLMQGFMFADAFEKFDTKPLNGTAIALTDVDPAVKATGTLTLTGQPLNTETVTIGGKVYTFQTALTNVDGNVLIGATASDSLDNLIAAINRAAGAGTLYAALTVAANEYVSAAAGAGDTMDLTALLAGTSGNAVATTETLTNGSFGGATLSGGVDGIYTAAAGLGGFLVGDLVKASGFSVNQNNGFGRVTVASATDPEIDGIFAANEAPTAAARLQAVGFQFASGDLTITLGVGEFTIGATVKNLTQLGLEPGEWIFLGGDVAAKRFASGYGYARVKSVSASAIVCDKATWTVATDAGAGKTVQMFFGTFLKNADDPSLIVIRSYQLERTLGMDDDGTQSQYLTGAFANEFTLNLPTANKLNADLGFVALDDEQRSGLDGIKAGSRVSALGESAFNTTSDVYRTRMTILDPSTLAPTALFAYLQEFTLSINNGVTALKAVGVLGGFDVSLGNFVVEGSCTAYFATVEATEAVRDNADVTIDTIFAKGNAGIVYDIPLLGLGDARPNVEKDQPITLPLEMFAAENELGYTLGVAYLNYLPTIAMPAA